MSKALVLIPCIPMFHDGIYECRRNNTDRKVITDHLFDHVQRTQRYAALSNLGYNRLATDDQEYFKVYEILHSATMTMLASHLRTLHVLYLAIGEKSPPIVFETFDGSNIPDNVIYSAKRIARLVGQRPNITNVEIFDLAKSFFPIPSEDSSDSYEEK